MNRIHERGLSYSLINFYRKNDLFVKCFDDGIESHYIAYVDEQNDYYLLVIKNDTNEGVTCMKLIYSKRANSISEDFKIEAYNKSMGL